MTPLLHENLEKKFPVDAHDWIYLNNKVAIKIKELSALGYKIVIFTNQAGIQKGHTKEEDIKTKLANIAAATEVEMQAFIASHEDEYRKPGTKMWSVFTESYNEGIKPNMKESFYCGDAAGRKDATHKDFSDADLYLFHI